MITTDKVTERWSELTYQRFHFCSETFHSRLVSRWAALFEGCATSQKDSSRQHGRVGSTPRPSRVRGQETPASSLHFTPGLGVPRVTLGDPCLAQARLGFGAAASCAPMPCVFNTDPERRALVIPTFFFGSDTEEELGICICVRRAPIPCPYGL